MNRKTILILIPLVLLMVVGVVLYALTSHRQPAQQSVAKPTVQLTIPADDLKAVSGTLKTAVTVGGQKLSRVEYRIDGAFAGVSYAPPYSLSIDVSGLAAGNHTLLAVIYNSTGASGQSQSVTFTIAPAAAPNLAATPTPTPSPAATPSPSATTSSSSSSHAATPTPTANPTPTPSPSPPPSPDTTPPSTPSITSLSDPGNFQVHVVWSTATDNVGVTGYQVWRDGSPLATTGQTSYDDTTSLPGHSYNYAVRAFDAAGNDSPLSTAAGIQLSEISVFSSSDLPANADANDPGSIEVGMRFRAVADGKVTGLRFYKAAANTGTHVGNLWTNTGTNLATVTFTSETASGWQVAHFASPVHITAGTTYVISYFDPSGHYSSSPSYFVVSHPNAYLSGLADGADGANGVYDYTGSGIFPTSSFNSTNYWIDPLFAPDTLASVATRSCPAWPALPDASCTGVPTGTTLTTFNGNLDITNDNTVIDGYDITGSVTVQGNNVVIKNSRIRSHIDARPAYQTGLLVEDSDLSPTTPTVSNFAPIDGTYTMLRTHVHDWQDGPHSSVGSVLIEDSISNDLNFQTGEHLDGYQQFGPGEVSNVVLDHDIISGCPSNDPDKGSSGMFWSDHPAAGSTFEAFHNQFSCGQYTIRINDANLGSGVIANVHDNVVVKNSWATGPYECSNSIVFNGVEGLEWANNNYDDGTPIDFHGCP